MLIYCRDLGESAVVRFSYCWLTSTGFVTQIDVLAPRAFIGAERDRFNHPVTVVMVDEFGYHRERFTI